MNELSICHSAKSIPGKTGFVCAECRAPFQVQKISLEKLRHVVTSLEEDVTLAELIDLLG